MKKIIEVDLIDEDSLFEKFNKRQVSNELISYLIKEVGILKQSDVITIIVNNYLSISDVKTLIKNKLSDEYNQTILRYQHNVYIQLIYLIIGISSLVLSSLIKENIFKELVLIGGWVLIWSMIEIEIFSDTELKRKRKILKQLLNSEIIENNLDN